jgi:hypothetical protein
VRKDNIVGDGGNRKSQVGGRTEQNGASNPNEIQSNPDKVEHYMLSAGEDSGHIGAERTAKTHRNPECPYITLKSRSSISAKSYPPNLNPSASGMCPCGTAPVPISTAPFPFRKKMNTRSAGTAMDVRQKVRKRHPRRWRRKTLFKVPRCSEMRFHSHSPS